MFNMVSEQAMIQSLQQKQSTRCQTSYKQPIQTQAKGKSAIGIDGHDVAGAAIAVSSPQVVEQAAATGRGDGATPGIGFGGLPPNPSHSPNFSTACQIEYEPKNKNRGWIFDCGATDTMTFDKNDILEFSKPLRTHVQTASGALTCVEGAGTIEISPTLRLQNCLYVPSLSHKLMSISHVTKELNCTMLMHPHFCFLHDIRTGEIIGRGTEQNGLYYVDEIAQQGKVMLAHGTADRDAWLWHRRLGHPSTTYLKLLFPKLVKTETLSCDSCVLAKSHRQSFKPNQIGRAHV